jgi:hypothetical protein
MLERELYESKLKKQCYDGKKDYRELSPGSFIYGKFYDRAKR